MSTEQVPSLYIPFVFTQTTDDKIKTVIEEEYQFGKIKQIDRVLKDGHCQHHSLYIYFHSFNTDEVTKSFLEHAKDTRDPPRLYYEEGKPWYWKAMLNRRVVTKEAVVVAPIAPCLPICLTAWLNEEPLVALPIAPCLPSATASPCLSQSFIPRVLTVGPPPTKKLKKKKLLSVDVFEGMSAEAI